MQDHELTADQARDLRALAGMIIPPSTVYDVPGADDEKIFGDILRNLERDRDDIRRALSHLAAIGGCAFADLRIGAPIRSGSRLSRGRRCAAGCFGSRRAAVLLPRRPGDAIARPGDACAFPLGACGRAGRLVAARSGTSAAADVSRGRVGQFRFNPRCSFSPPSTRPCAGRGRGWGAPPQIR